LFDSHALVDGVAPSECMYLTNNSTKIEQGRAKEHERARARERVTTSIKCRQRGSHSESEKGRKRARTRERLRHKEGHSDKNGDAEARCTEPSALGTGHRDAEGTRRVVVVVGCHQEVCNKYK
jgi:hypothetical protein